MENAEGQQNTNPARNPAGQPAQNPQNGGLPGVPGRHRRRRRHRRHRGNGQQPGQQNPGQQQQNRQGQPGQPGNRNFQQGQRPGQPQRFPGGQRPQQGPQPQNRFPGKPQPKPKVFSPELRDIPIPPELLQPVIEKPFFSLVKPVSPEALKEEQAAAPTETPPETQAPDASPACPVCSMPVRSQFTALKRKDDGQLVHFDCALRDLARINAEKLGRFKKIYYIGGGSFAIVKEIFDKRGRFKSYEVVEKIPYEPKEK